MLHDRLAQAFVKSVRQHSHDALLFIDLDHFKTLIAEKIRTALNQPYVLKGQPYRSSPSIGISLFQGEQKTRDELLKHADIALYRAKKAGRNAVRCYDGTAVA